MTSHAAGSVWVFTGEGGQFPAGVFLAREHGEQWIGRHGLTGMLTEYPVGVAVYEWAIENGYFAPQGEEHKSPKFIARFTSARLSHAHYEDGRPVG
jgi:hypothetical protein